MNLLAIEISTSSAKAMIYTVGQGIQKVHSIPFDKSICDVASQDPLGVFDALVDCVKVVIQDDRENIDAIGICTAWHSLMFLDTNRYPIGRIYTWANSTASQTAKKYRKDSDLCSWIYHRTGCMVNSTYPLWQYIHVRDTNPDFCQKTAYLSSQQEYVFERLTGEIAVSRCTSSGSGLLNTHTLDWDDKVLAFAGITREQLAPLKEPTYSAPLKSDMAKKLGLSAGIPVMLGGADGAMNQIGASAVKEGVMTLSVGTSSAIRLVSSEAVLPANPSTWCYYLGEGMHIVGASTVGAGNCVEWFLNSMSLGSRLNIKDLDRAVESVNILQAPVFLPFLYGERCPGWLDQRLGGFMDLNSEHGLVDMYFSLLEGIIFNLYHCYELLTDLMAAPEKILVSGGIVRSGFWVQMLADIFQKEMIISNLDHVSLLGVVALLQKSLCPNQDSGQESLEDGTVISPNKEMNSIYNKRFERYKDLYDNFSLPHSFNRSRPLPTHSC